MMKRLFTKLFGYNPQDIETYTSHLGRAVSKLCQAVGYTADRAECTDETGDVLAALEASVKTIKALARELDDKRLGRVADEEEAWEEKVRTANRLEQLQRALDDKSTEAMEAGLRRKALAEGLIKFRDQLDYFEEEYTESGDETSVKLLQNLNGEVGRLMRKNGIEPLEAGGGFDATRHMISATKNTDQPELDHTLAGTSKAGYMIDGELHRTQEVVLYVYQP